MDARIDQPVRGKGPRTGCANVNYWADKIASLIRDRAVVIALQPIAELGGSGRLIGAEALSRFDGTYAEHTPEEWFSSAPEGRPRVDLECFVAGLALKTVSALGPQGFLSINFSSATITSEGFRERVFGSGVDPSRIVIEVTEREFVRDYAAAGAVLAAMRRDGFRVAVDDVGAARANLHRLVQLRPDFIKLDKSMVAGVDGDPVRRAMAAALAAFARDTSVTLIAEGIEHRAERDALTAAGVPAGQGYFLARPSTEPSEWRRWLHSSLPVTSPAPTHAGGWT